jgi:hypothetical protein
MASYFSIIVINPADWEQYLESQDSLPASLQYNPTGNQSPSFEGAANATLQEFYFQSDRGYPQDGSASITITADTVDTQGIEHRETFLYVGSVIGGEAFRFDQTKYPIIDNIY